MCLKFGIVSIIDHLVPTMLTIWHLFEYYNLTVLNQSLLFVAKHRKSKSPLAKEGVQAILTVSVAVASLIAVIVAYCLVKKGRKGKKNSLAVHRIHVTSDHCKYVLIMMMIVGS